MVSLVQAAQSGVETGLATKGKLSGIGFALKNVADRLRGTRETKEALGTLEKTEEVKQRIKAKYEKPDTEKDILGLLSGIKGPESAFAPAVSSTGGPIVPGPGGRLITGETPPGEEFETTLGLSQAELLRRKLGVTQEEAQRKYLGLPKAQAQTGQITPAVAIRILSDPIQSRQYKKEFGEEAFQNLKAIASGGVGKVSLTKKDETNIMDTNF